MRISVRAPSATTLDVAESGLGTSDFGLVAMVTDDPASFALLYRRFFDQVYWFCFSRLGDAEAAEDATSQVFVKILVALPRFEVRGASFRSWLFRIAHNVVVDEFRSSRPHAPLTAAANVESTGPTPEDQAIAEERHRLLEHLMTHLPEDQRRVVELRLAGLSSVEIGKALGRRPGAVDTMLWRAMNRLRDVLAETSEPPTDQHEEGGHAPR